MCDTLEATRSIVVEVESDGAGGRESGLGFGDSPVFVSGLILFTTSGLGML